MSSGTPTAMPAHPRHATPSTRWDGLRTALSAGVVMLTAMALLAAAEHLSGWTVFALPFVATAGVLALAPKAPLARPAAVVLSYAASALIAITLAAVVGPSVVVATAGAVASVVTMLMLKAPHPPAAVAAALIGLNNPGYGYLVQAVLPAVVIVVATALLAGRLLPGYGYAVAWR